MRPDRLGRLKSIHDRHLTIHDDGVPSFCLGGGERRGAVIDDMAIEAQSPEHELDHPFVAGYFCVAPLLGVETRFPQQLEHADDAAHGSANFMAHGGQEIAFRPAGGFGPALGEPHVRDEIFVLKDQAVVPAKVGVVQVGRVEQ